MNVPRNPWKPNFLISYNYTDIWPVWWIPLVKWPRPLMLMTLQGIPFRLATHCPLPITTAQWSLKPRCFPWAKVGQSALQ